MRRIWLPWVILFSGCAQLKPQPVFPPPADLKVSETTQPTYTWLKRNVFGKICAYCHAGRTPHLLVYDSIKTVVVPGKPLESRLYYMVYTNRMPKSGRGLSPEKKWAIYQWIKNGAKND